MSIPFRYFEHFTAKSSPRPRVPTTMGWRIGRKRIPTVDKVMSDWKKAANKAEKRARLSGWEKKRDIQGEQEPGRDNYAVAPIPSQKTIEEDTEVIFILLIIQIIQNS